MKSFRYNINSNGSRSGWYVGPMFYEFFDNKWDAIEYASTSNNHYKAYLNDASWDKADWTREPTESIEQLQKNHAEYLREKYNTLVLFYSGGVDSSTVLNTFIKNKIPLDYIYVQYVEDPDKSFNKDVHLAMQYLKENKDKLLGAEVLYEKKLDHHEGNSIYNFKEQLREVNWQLRFHHIGLSTDLKIRQPNIYKKVEDNGCIIAGSNKPYVYRDKKGFYTQYVDEDDENWGDHFLEMFWLGEDPSLQIKQCHLAKQWLEERNLTRTDKIYQSEDTVQFWSLNQSFGRESIDEFFFQKHCFSDYVGDRYFRQHYGKKWGNSHWAEYFKNWHGTQSYFDLIKQLDKLDKKFMHTDKPIGWLTEKRYLE